MKVGIIGLGNMGAPMARRLLVNGHDLKAFDTNAQIAPHFAGHWADSLRDVGADRDVIVTMLPNGQIVREVLLGEAGALAAALPGTLVVDTSSSDPSGTIALGTELAARGFTLIDAPVSGGVPLASQGRLSLMIGCNDPSALERARPVLQAFGERHVEVGRLGCGHAAKAINNAIAATIIAITSEGLLLGERCGITPATLLDVINSSTGKSLVSETVFKTQILPRKFNLGFSMGLMSKDVDIAASLSKRLALDLPILETASASWSAACGTLGSTTDSTAFLRAVEIRNGMASSGLD
ncbi:MAG: NAD(P)-dependent oxidoreductase [Steroidobacteraceae bacterium]